MTTEAWSTLTVVQAAMRLNVQPAVVRRRIAEGKIAAMRSGRSWRIEMSEVERLRIAERDRE